MRNPIFDIDNWREIGNTLSRNKTRTFLTAFGIFWGTAMLALLWGGAAGMEGMLRRNFSGMATNIGVIASQRTTISYRGFNKGHSWQLNDTDIAGFKRAIPELEAASAIINKSSVNVAYGSKSSVTRIMGVEGCYNSIQIPVIYSGRFINESDISGIRKVAILGKNVATEIFGSESPIGKFVSVGGIFYQVVGVAGQTSEVNIGGSRIDDTVFVPISTMRRAFGAGSDIDFYIFSVIRGHSPSELRPKFERVIRANHPIHPDDHNAVRLMDVSEEFNKIDNIFLGISLLAIFIGAGTLLAGVIGVGNIMWIIVKERTQEIGIRRAIGAKPRDIIMQVLCEGMVLTTVAGVAGLSFATSILGVIDIVTTDPTLGHAGFELLFSHAIFIMFTFIFLGTSAGFIPAIKAMRIKPIEALNSK